MPNGIDLSNSVENEHLCLRLVGALGLPAAASEIAEFEGRRVLVERFDRRWTKDKRLLRMPQEDCCQALSIPPTLKYENDGGPGIRALLQLLQASDTAEADQRVFMTAQIVFWLLGATDGHAKNFSIFLASGGRFRLTPLYDVMSTQPNVDAGEIRHNRMRMAMAVGQRRHYVVNTITPRHFLQTATLSGIPQRMVQDIFDELSNTALAAAESVLAELPDNFPDRMTQAIIAGMRTRLQLLVCRGVM